MLKKSLSILLTLVLSLSIVAAYPIKGNAKSINEKTKKEYKSKKEIKDGDLDILIEENSPDDVKVTVYNKLTNYTVTSVMERKEKKAHILTTSKNSNQDEVVQEYAIDEQTNTINSLPPILNDVDPGHEPGSYYFTLDNLYYIAENPWNPNISSGVPYSHVDYEHYQLSPYTTKYFDGTLYRNLHISDGTSSALTGYTGAILCGALGAIVGGYLGKSLPAALATGFITQTCALVLNLTGNELLDEKGCIWVRYDMDPEISYSTVYDSLGNPMHVTDYTFDFVMVGPYWKTNVTLCR